MEAHVQLLTLATALCALVGCDRHTNRMASDSDVTGTWRLSPDSARLLESDGFIANSGQTLTISFASNGSLAFHSVLEHDGKAVYHDDNGSWELQHDVPVDNESARANCVRVNLRALSYTFPLSVAYEGKFKLWTYYGDPGRGTQLVYERDLGVSPLVNAKDISSP